MHWGQERNPPGGSWAAEIAMELPFAQLAAPIKKKKEETRNYGPPCVQPKRGKKPGTLLAPTSERQKNPQS